MEAGDGAEWIEGRVPANHHHAGGALLETEIEQLEGFVFFAEHGVHGRGTIGSERRGTAR